MTDDELQRAYRRVTAPAPRGAHPEPERIAELVQGILREPERIALLDHVMQCASCRAELDFLRSASEGARAADTARFPMRWTVFAAAAALLIGVSAVALRHARPDATADVYRGQRPAMSLVLPTAGSTVAQPVRLAWQSVADARNYRVELLSARGDVIASWNTSDTALAIPDSIRLDASEPYDVWVRATLADRTDVSSPIIRFTVK